MQRTLPRKRGELIFWLAAAIAVLGPGTHWAGTTEVGEPTVGFNGVVVFKVSGEFRGSKNAARESALHEAQDQIRQWLSKQSPPINRAPSIETIRREMAGREIERIEPLNSEEMYQVSFEVELSNAHIRALRARERCLSGLWALGEIMAVLGVAVAFFRVEEWTKGYLTRWLTVGSAVLLSVVLALMWWVK